MVGFNHPGSFGKQSKIVIEKNKYQMGKLCMLLPNVILGICKILSPKIVSFLRKVFLLGEPRCDHLYSLIPPV